ncbi:MAG: hypothetical protein CVU08_09015 [Bacteroidetes bacterium HGW-Bacteroidetes-3]|jgi:hypothetical protein|nr:MAG: hypothetical protein CVU08_09015 [Bacteroidetes bacterium HGW-Bacteroidetes-3]
MKMALIPFKNIEIETSLNHEDVFKRLSNITDEVNSLKIGGIKTHFKNYEGVFNFPRLKIRRIPKIGYSAFLPIANIKFSDKNERTVYLSLHLHKYVQFFLLIVASFLIFQVGILYLNSLSDTKFSNQESIKILKETMTEEELLKFETDTFSKSGNLTQLYTNISILIAGYILLVFNFNNESKILVEDIEGLLKDRDRS